jgi:hypothetical protein
MTLLRAQVQQAIEIVSSDSAARSRIDSILAPVLGRHSGFFRNVLLATGFGFAKLPGDAIVAVGRRGAAPPFAVARYQQSREIPLDPNRKGTLGYELQCTEIATTAAAAIERHKARIPGLKTAFQCARTEGFAHAGVQLDMDDGSQYVLDWWLTLDVANPVVFRFADFDLNRQQGGVAFERFTLFP